MDQDVESRAHVALIKNVLGCYLRYFAGRPHGACDKGHLHELVQRFGHHQERARTDTFEAHHAVLSRLLADLESLEPSPPSERANHLALLANQQFLLFERHTGMPRASRRPALLERIVSVLDQIVSELEALPTEALTSRNRANLALIHKRRLQFRAEATESANEYEGSPPQRARMLATAANVEIAAYQKGFEGRDRTAVDIEQLAGMSDRMGEIVYQLLEIIPALDEQALVQASNDLQVASAHLDRFELEHNVIAELRKQFTTLVHVVESAAVLREQLMAADASEAVRRQAVAHLDAFITDPVVREIVDRSTRR